MKMVSVTMHAAGLASHRRHWNQARAKLTPLQRHHCCHGLLYKLASLLNNRVSTRAKRYTGPRINTSKSEVSGARTQSR